MFETFGDEVAHPLQIGRPAWSRAEVVEVDDEGIVVRAKGSLKLELGLEENPSFWYEEEEPSVPYDKRVCSRKRRLSSSKIRTGKRRGKPRRAVKTATTGNC